MFFFISSLIFGFLSAYAAKKRNRNVGIWFLLGAISGIAIFIVVSLPYLCPHCKKENGFVKDKLVCSHCGKKDLSQT